jgi:hypothetical protein
LIKSTKTKLLDFLGLHQKASEGSYIVLHCGRCEEDVLIRTEELYRAMELSEESNGPVACQGEVLG